LLIGYAGHVVGDGFAVQANMMADPEVGPAMAECFRVSTESFPRRLLAALDAGQAAGGDARGMMSAALLVVDGDRCDPWAGRLTDLRVDRSDDPLHELRQLLEASEAFADFYRAVALSCLGTRTPRSRPWSKVWPHCLTTRTCGSGTHERCSLGVTYEPPVPSQAPRENAGAGNLYAWRVSDAGTRWPLSVASFRSAPAAENR
jgi:hypothetical protein